MKIEQANKMTAQELCDYAVAKIVEQGGQSLSESSGICAMLGSNGRRCAFSYVLDGDDPVCMRYIGPASGFIEEHQGKVPAAFLESPEIADKLVGFHDAVTKSLRRSDAECLHKLGISTDAPQYQQWIDMGEAV